VAHDPVRAAIDQRVAHYATVAPPGQEEAPVAVGIVQVDGIRPRRADGQLRWVEGRQQLLGVYLEGAETGGASEVRRTAPREERHRVEVLLAGDHGGRWNCGVQRQDLARAVLDEVQMGAVVREVAADAELARAGGRTARD